MDHGKSKIGIVNRRHTLTTWVMEGNGRLHPVKTGSRRIQDGSLIALLSWWGCHGGRGRLVTGSPVHVAVNFQTSCWRNLSVNCRRIRRSENFLENRVNSICKLKYESNFIRGGVRGGNNATPLYFLQGEFSRHAHT